MRGCFDYIRVVVEAAVILYVGKYYGRIIQCQEGNNFY